MMKMLYAVILMAAGTGALAQNANRETPPLEVSRVKIEATELDRRTLLTKLNAHGVDHRMKFEAVEEDFAYRIVFTTSQETALQSRHRGGSQTYNTSSASAYVYDNKGAELFEFKRRLRSTDGGSTNAVAKEIIKRLLKLKG